MIRASGVSELLGGNPPPGDGQQPVTPPRQNDTLGVTVENVPIPNEGENEWQRKAWYVLRTPYFRAERVKDNLDGQGFRTFLPKRKVMKLVQGKRRKVWQALIPNTVFVYANRQQTEQLIHDTPGLPVISYVYDHCQHLDSGKNPPLIIPTRQMDNFIRLMSIDNDHIVDVTQNHITYRLNDRVRITDGQFKGIEGRVAKIFGQTRVVVELEGLCLLATAYIPKAFLEMV